MCPSTVYDFLIFTAVPGAKRGTEQIRSALLLDGY